MPKPLIAINSDIKRNVSKCADYLSVYTAYAEAVERAGGLPLVIPPLEDDADVADSLRAAQGLLLIGGEDIAPATYGQEKHPETSLMFEQREKFDMRLIRAALEMRLPILAVCGGHQEVNVALGGTLHQHVPDAYGLQITHTRAADLAERGEEQYHRIDIKPDSRLARIVRSTRIEVNSSHHQALDRLGEGLRAVATSVDGVVEAVEFDAKSERGFLISVQWHPERIHQRLEQLAIFRALVDEAFREGGQTSAVRRKGV